MSRPKHRVHTFRVIARCACGEPLLFECSYRGRARGEQSIAIPGERGHWETYACLALSTYQRRHNGKHHVCPIAKVPRRRYNLRVAALRVFGDILKSPIDTPPTTEDNSPIGTSKR